MQGETQTGLKIVGCFAGVCVPTSPGGVASYGAIIRIDDAISWRASGFAGNGAGASTNRARFHGAIALLHKLQELVKAQPGADVMVITDSKTAIQELEGNWQSGATEYWRELEEARELLSTFTQGVVTRWCGRTDNAEALELALQMLRRSGVHRPEQFLARMR
jgi:ribonuclease HI